MAAIGRPIHADEGLLLDRLLPSIETDPPTVASDPNLPVASVCFTALKKAELRRAAGATLLASQRKISVRPGSSVDQPSSVWFLP